MKHLGRSLVPIVLLSAAVSPACAPRATALPTPPASYIGYVANEASDVVSRILFSPSSGIAVQRRVGVGAMGRIEGPHGVAVSPDGSSWFVSLAHGSPNGRVARYSAAGDTLVARVTVGLFPESITLTPDGRYLFVANSDLQG